MSVHIIKDIFAKQRSISQMIMADRFDFVELTKSSPIDRAFWVENFRLALSQEYLELLEAFEDENRDINKILAEFADCLAYLANMSMMIKLKEEIAAQEFLKGLEEEQKPQAGLEDLFRIVVVHRIFKLLILLQHCKRWKWFGPQGKPINPPCLVNIKSLWYSFGCLANRNNMDIQMINDTFNLKHNENLLRLEQGYYKNKLE